MTTKQYELLLRFSQTRQHAYLEFPMKTMDEYDRLAITMKIEDISSCKYKQGILRRLKENGQYFDRGLWLQPDDGSYDEFCASEGWCPPRNDYFPDNEKEFAWLGYFLGKCTNVAELYIADPLPSCKDGIEIFRSGLGRNRSIRRIAFVGHRIERRVIELVDLFFRNNNHLLEIEVTNCNLGNDGHPLLLSMLKCCKNNGSLKSICFANNVIGDGQLSCIITSLSMYQQLESIDLAYMNIGRNECIMLATLIRNTKMQLQRLILCGNNVDDVGAKALADAISGSKPNIKLKTLGLHENGIADEGWAHFSRLLCDTSSVNNTYLSNHTLSNLGTIHQPLPNDLASYLDLNRSSENKGQIAMTKILQHHYHFNIQPFLKWEFKVLPLVIAWLEKANACTFGFEEKLARMKLSMTYDFVKELPMLYIEPCTRREIKEYSALEKKLQGDQSQKVRLEEVKQRKARAMRRL